MIRALDVSNYQPRDVYPVAVQLGVDLVIVRLFCPWETTSGDYSVEQLASVASLERGGYVWCYAGVDPGLTIDKALQVAARGGLAFSERLPLWLDHEEYDGEPAPDGEWCRRAEWAASERGVPIGWYTRAGLWAERCGYASARPFWLADYDGVAGLDTAFVYGRVIGKQYTDRPYDLSVFELAPAVADPLEGYRTCIADMGDRIGDEVAASAARLAITPCSTRDRLREARRLERAVAELRREREQFIGGRGQ